MTYVAVGYAICLGCLVAYAITLGVRRHRLGSDDEIGDGVHDPGAEGRP